jgi:hypothetical protein
MENSDRLSERDDQFLNTLYQDAAQHLSATKSQMWTVTNYAVSVLVAIILINAKQPSQLLLVLYSAIITATAILAIWHIRVTQHSLAEKRQRMQRIRNKYPATAGAYGREDNERDRPWRDKASWVPQLAAILISAMFAFGQLIWQPISLGNSSEIVTKQPTQMTTQQSSSSTPPPSAP